ncbi:MAG: FliM/FliN family flagellar motor switch protein [Pseudomonadota bacterium]
MTWWRQELDRVLRHVCKEKFQLDVNVRGLHGKRANAPEALGAMPKVVLPMLLDASRHRSALFVLDGALIDGMIEQQLLGDVLPTERLDRPVTAIDAGLNEPFVKAALDAICTQGSGQLTDLTFKRMEQDRAALRLALGEGEYDILEAQLDMGPGIKTGRFELWVPAVDEGVARSKNKQNNTELMKLLSSSPVTLETWLSGCEATAHQLMNLEAGSILLLPRTALARVDVKDRNGGAFAQAKLGQLHGVRAIRLTELHGKPSDTVQTAAPSIVPPVDEAAKPAAIPSAPAVLNEQLESDAVSPTDQKPSALAG